MVPSLPSQHRKRNSNKLVRKTKFVLLRRVSILLVDSFYGSYIIYLLCFSFKGSNDNAEALVTSVQYKRGSFLKTTRLSQPYESFFLSLTLLFSSFLSFFLSFFFPNVKEFKNLANFPARYDQ